MVGDILQPTHLLFVLVVALLVLGPKRLPEVAKTLGNGLRDFRSALSGDSDHDDDEPPRNVLAPEAPPAHEPEAASVVAEPEPAKPQAPEPQPTAPSPAAPPAEGETTTSVPAALAPEPPAPEPAEAKREPEPASPVAAPKPSS